MSKAFFLNTIFKGNFYQKCLKLKKESMRAFRDLLKNKKVLKNKTTYAKSFIS